MKSIRKTITGAFLASTLTMGAAGAGAVSWELSGKMTVETSLETPQELRNLEGTPFLAYLTYDEAALPREQSRDIAYYSRQGSLVLTTDSGSVDAELGGLTTIIYPGESPQFSRFTGSANQNRGKR